MFMITTLTHEAFGWVTRLSGQGGGSSRSGEGRCGGRARSDPVLWLLRTNLSFPFDEPVVSFVRLEEQTTQLVG